MVKIKMIFALVRLTSLSFHLSLSHTHTDTHTTLTHTTHTHNTQHTQHTHPLPPLSLIRSLPFSHTLSLFLSLIPSSPGLPFSNLSTVLLLNSALLLLDEQLDVQPPIIPCPTFSTPVFLRCKFTLHCYVLAGCAVFYIYAHIVLVLLIRCVTIHIFKFHCYWLATRPTATLDACVGCSLR